VAARNVAKQIVGKDSHVTPNGDDLDLGALVLATDLDHPCQVGDRFILRRMLFRRPQGMEMRRVPNDPAPDVLDGGEGAIDLHCVLPQNALTTVASSSRRPEFCMLFTFCPLGAQ